MPKRQLFPYQKEGVRQVERWGLRALIGDEMGLGKSIQALMALRRNLDLLPAVIVCEANTKWQWEHYVLDVLRIKPVVISGRKPKSRNPFAGTKPRILIINYDILTGWTQTLKRLHPQFVVLDECQAIANHLAKRTKAARRLCRGVPAIIGLSATPIKNRPIEFFPILNLMQPDEFPSRFEYGLRYCGGRLGFWGWEYKGATRLKELHKRVTHPKKGCMIRRRVAEVKDDLPEKVREIVPLDLSRPKEYAEARDNFIVWLKKNKPGKAARAARAAHFTQLGYLLRLCAELKLGGVVDWANHWLDNSEPDRKLVLFGIHKKMLAALHERVKAKSLVIDGSVTGKKRKQAVDQFRNDNSVRVAIGNIKAMGTGVDGLQERASTMAFTELGLVPAWHDQAEGRLRRIGQREITLVYYLVAHGTVEEKLCQLIQHKQQIVTDALDGGSTSGDELNMYDLLIESMLNGSNK